ncbi:hypothetical protein Kfla_3251 [Kribbella flavida DSM 17836]|uniref:MinD-like ATPase involved in chromosome partitioning or flagellar assembly n=1 Tax=Kribbella flavida (strain DSM 17836 / JCM 10339 / NBRC 14399) TaxID=479435 RepID=D2Q4J8_KRIFD|nr:hypothetical protein [Kribbella flavida]ADB32312.1 hypothetical protein Kfla_3251 [Kribbella flavida DSM 17836]
MTGPNWQADMMARLDDESATAAAPPESPAGAGQPPVQQPAPEPTMPPPPAPVGAGWGAPVPPQEQQPQYTNQSPHQPQYQAQQQWQQPAPPQGPYQEQQWQQPPQSYGPPQQQAPYYPPQQYAPPPEQQYQYQQPAPPYPQYQQPPVQQYEPQGPPPYQQAPAYEQPPYGAVPPAPYQEQYAPPPPQYPPQPQQYGPPPQQQYQAAQQQAYQPPPQQYPQPQPPAYDPNYGPPAQYQQGYEQPPVGDGSWNAPAPQEPTGWDTPMPDGGPGPQAYTPSYQDPLAGPLPVASDSVGLQHEDRPGGFFRRIGRFAAEAAYIAGASGRMQRDVENIAVIRRPIGIGRMIGVVGPVPQAGTSTVTALLADTIAAQRSDIVLAVDACPREGKLTHRLAQGITSTPGARIQLARAEPTADAISDVLAARNVGGANQIPISLVDCPAGLFEQATGYVAGSAHAVALVIPSSRDDALSSINQLDQLSVAGQQMLVQKGLVIIAENRPDDPEPVRWLQSAVSDRGLGYVVLPYDEHLARVWPLRPEQLEPATRRAALELAARLVERATR